ncbi:hypothetical protein GWO43_20745, partial [candidate division KSB1 bacterium]|nr:hypothetical protein [candidate division KSB1 bacterium]NIR70231.1 hypothetical protein [candidate division KSB1 bacterium]NIS26502.1 hypothetical protein [candidate division KSB1 bacterium]NIT73264.1 hypothetical protein [candidate division KSB1 bacterium]NIU23888.1 hypothetical protein [candidate division KSB1 bacterium]
CKNCGEMIQAAA